VPLEARVLEMFSAEKDGWVRPAGVYAVEVGGSSVELPLKTEVTLAGR
jgi:hypothetical protein